MPSSICKSSFRELIVSYVFNWTSSTNIIVKTNYPNVPPKISIQLSHKLDSNKEIYLVWILLKVDNKILDNKFDNAPPAIFVTSPTAPIKIASQLIEAGANCHHVHLLLASLPCCRANRQYVTSPPTNAQPQTMGFLPASQSRQCLRPPLLLPSSRRLNAVFTYYNLPTWPRAILESLFHIALDSALLLKGFRVLMMGPFVWLAILVWDSFVVTLCGALWYFVQTK